jgi:hypothetical protein
MRKCDENEVRGKRKSNGKLLCKLIHCNHNKIFNEREMRETYNAKLEVKETKKVRENGNKLFFFIQATMREAF